MKLNIHCLIIILILMLTGCYAKYGHKDENSGNYVWVKEGHRVEDQENVKSISDFGAALWLVDDRKLFENWNQPEEPYFNPISKVRRNTAIFTAVIFVNPTYDQSGRTDITYDLSIFSPNGQLFGKFNGLTGHIGKLKRKKNALYLGKSRMGINIPNDQPSGTYRVKADVYDNLGKLKLTLHHDFLLFD